MRFQHSGAKIRVFHRAQTSLNLALLFSDSTSILYLNWGNFQRKVGGELT